MLAANAEPRLQEDALSIYKRLAEKTGLDERLATFLVNTMGCRTLGDLENVSELQVDEIITDLEAPLVMGSRLKRLIRTIQEASRVSLGPEHAGAGVHEGVALPSEELRRLDALFFGRYKLRIPVDEDADESVVSRLKHQLSKHYIKFEDILKTKTRKGESAEIRIERRCQDLSTVLGNKTGLGEHEKAEQKNVTITAEDYLSALWTYILGLARAGVEEIRDRPEADETSDSQTYDYVQIPLDVMINYHSRAKRFAASLPRNQAFTILKDADEAERLLWQSPGSESRHDHPGDHDGASTYLDRARQNMGDATNRTSKTSSSHNGTPPVRRHSQKTRYVGNKTEEQHNPLPSISAQPVCR